MLRRSGEERFLGERIISRIGIKREVVPLVLKPPHYTDYPARSIMQAKATMRIDVKKEFERQIAPPAFKPTDYTDYPSGEKKISTGKAVPGNVTICQDGLAKRTKEIFKKTREMANNNQVPPAKDKPTQNVGILLYVDKFFNWVNKAIGV